MFLIDRKCLRKVKFKVIIKRIQRFIRVHDINEKLYNYFEYIELNFYIINELFDKILIKVYFCHKIYLINNFRTNVLLKVNILKIERIILNISKRNIIFSICD